MTVTGIIAEFNPFHHGHKYLLDQVEGLKVLVMSGNFVQRGEPAIVDKWTRAQMALNGGADLVVELPFGLAVQSADYFAQGAVDLLAKLGCDQIAFGTENVLDYTAISQVYRDKKEQMLAYLDSLPDHLSYPQKTQAMWQTFAGLTFSGQSPNHILALAYAKAASDYNITLRGIARKGQEFHSKEKGDFASATAIRHHLDDPAFIQRAMPDASLFAQAVKLSWDNFYPYLTYQVLTHPDLTSFPQVNDELANRLKLAIKEAKSVEDLVQRVATKRYTKARVRRLLTYILVGAQEHHVPEGIHVLAFSSAGQAHLKTLKKDLKLITRIGSQPWDPLTQQADQVYQLGHPQLVEQTWGRVPIKRLQ